jgi:hypothetical protein
MQVKVARSTVQTNVEEEAAASMNFVAPNTAPSLEEAAASWNKRQSGLISQCHPAVPPINYK